jgi:hypothetical protein
MVARKRYRAYEVRIPGHVGVLMFGSAEVRRHVPRRYGMAVRFDVLEVTKLLYRLSCSQPIGSKKAPQIRGAKSKKTVDVTNATEAALITVTAVTSCRFS